jgi:hypothetical protein
MGDGLQATGYGQKKSAPARVVHDQSPVTRSTSEILFPLPLWERVRVWGRQAAATLLVGVALTGCGNIEPWVKPYERQALADPIMSLDPHPVSTSYMHHVFEAREGARGALGSAGGGCGCN